MTRVWLREGSELPLLRQTLSGSLWSDCQTKALSSAFRSNRNLVQLSGTLQEITSKEIFAKNP